jgi:glycosyltransferase involved in cell wall biosynthesis
MPDVSRSLPLVSIVIPTYNRANLISESIQSVLSQTYENWELIIVDDGSADNTAEVIREYNNPRIRYLKIDHSGILGKVRNCGIKMAKGEYIAFLDSDDLWRSDKLALQLQLFKAHNIMFAFSNGFHFGDAVTVQPPDFQDLFVGNLFLPLILEHRFVVYMPSFIFKKEVFNQIGMINEDLKSGGDMDFVYRMSQAFTGAFSNERLVSIRKHNKGMSAKYEETAHLEDIKIITHFFKQKALTRKQHARLTGNSYYKLGLLNLANSQPGRAMHFFKSHIALLPLNYKGWLRMLQALIRKVISKTSGAIPT